MRPDKPRRHSAIELGVPNLRLAGTHADKDGSATKAAKQRLAAAKAQPAAAVGGKEAAAKCRSLWSQASASDAASRPARARSNSMPHIFGGVAGGAKADARPGYAWEYKRPEDNPGKRVGGDVPAAAADASPKNKDGLLGALGNKERRPSQMNLEKLQAAKAKSEAEPQVRERARRVCAPACVLQRASSAAPPFLQERARLFPVLCSGSGG